MMTRKLILIVFLLAAGLLVWAAPVRSKEPTTMPAKASPLDYAVQDISEKPYDLSQHKGQVVMIVNTASNCGLTPQYKGLEALYKKYKDRGFVVLGFPANNFREQEPGTNQQIARFCQQNYGVSFPMMSKISVKGGDQAPIYHHLTDRATAGDEAGEIKWNFTKFLLGRDGKILSRFEPGVTPEDEKITNAIESALQGQ